MKMSVMVAKREVWGEPGWERFHTRQTRRAVTVGKYVDEEAMIAFRDRPMVRAAGRTSAVHHGISAKSAPTPLHYPDMLQRQGDFCLE